MSGNNAGESALREPKTSAPTVTSLQDLTIKNQPKYCTFYLVTPEEELYFGESNKNKSLLHHVPDHEVYPQVHKNRQLTVPRSILKETLIIAQISKNPHPYIIKYYGYGVESAVKYLHSLGLAHNDINPDNIIVKDGMPSLGTPGWYDELFYTSKKKYDIYSLKKLEEWLEEDHRE
ncbi:hypothetical protein V8F33_012825 [Rhypophila sp. PSN 637]